MRRDNKLAKIEKVVDDWLNKRSFIALDDVYDLIQNEIEALTRRNAELTAALETIAHDENVSYMACSDLPACPKGDKHAEDCAVGIARRALTPTESEAK